MQTDTSFCRFDEIFPKANSHSMCCQCSPTDLSYAPFFQKSVFPGADKYWVIRECKKMKQKYPDDTISERLCNFMFENDFPKVGEFKCSRRDLTEKAAHKRSPQLTTVNGDAASSTDLLEPHVQKSRKVHVDGESIGEETSDRWGGPTVSRLAVSPVTARLSQGRVTLVFARADCEA